MKDCPHAGMHWDVTTVADLGPEAGALEGPPDRQVSVRCTRCNRALAFGPSTDTPLTDVEWRAREISDGMAGAGLDDGAVPAKAPTITISDDEYFGIAGHDCPLSYTPTPGTPGEAGWLALAMIDGAVLLKIPERWRAIISDVATDEVEAASRRVRDLEVEVERLTECLRVADADRVPLAMDLQIARDEVAELRGIAACVMVGSGQPLQVVDGCVHIREGELALLRTRLELAERGVGEANERWARIQPLIRALHAWENATGYAVDRRNGDLSDAFEVWQQTEADGLDADAGEGIAVHGDAETSRQHEAEGIARALAPLDTGDPCGVPRQPDDPGVSAESGGGLTGVATDLSEPA